MSLEQPPRYGWCYALDCDDIWWQGCGLIRYPCAAPPAQEGGGGGGGEGGGHHRMVTKLGGIMSNVAGDGDSGVCNCVTGTPHVDANGVCTCINNGVPGAIPPKPTIPPPTGMVWTYNVYAGRWGLTTIPGTTPRFQTLGLGGTDLLAPGGGLSTFFQSNKTLVYVGLGIGAYLLLKKK